MSAMNNKHTWPLAPLNLPFCIPFRGLFTDQEIDKIVEIGSRLELEPSTTSTVDTTSGVAKPANTFTEYRTSKSKLIPVSEENSWLFGKIAEAVSKVNKEIFNFDISIIECLQFSVYKTGEYYKSHVDIGEVPPYSTRKLSFVVQLTDETEYAGGDLNLLVSEIPYNFSRRKGDIIFFPSYLLHEVTPVTNGERRTLVGWVLGPSKFK